MPQTRKTTLLSTGSAAKLLVFLAALLTVISICNSVIPSSPALVFGPPTVEQAIREKLLSKDGVVCVGATAHGRLYEVNGYPILELSGTPEEMGEAHGRLLGQTVGKVVRDVLKPQEDPTRYRIIIEGARVMEQFQPEPYRREMQALARAAGVPYMEIVALQLYGDAERGRPPAMRVNPLTTYQCSNYAAFGPATRTGECIVGRNFDYWYPDVARYASIIIHYRPAKGRSFVTLSWVGVING